MNKGKVLPCKITSFLGEKLTDVPAVFSAIDAQGRSFCLSMYSLSQEDVSRFCTKLSSLAVKTPVLEPREISLVNGHRVAYKSIIIEDMLSLITNQDIESSYPVVKNKPI